MLVKMARFRPADCNRNFRTRKSVGAAYFLEIEKDKDAHTIKEYKLKFESTIVFTLAF